MKAATKASTSLFHNTQNSRRFVIEAQNRTDISSTIFRLSNAVGSPESPQCNSWKLVVNDLCKQVTSKGIMKLNSSEFIQRDFLPISTVVDVIESSLSNSQFEDEIFNLSSKTSLNLKELTDIISERFNLLFGSVPEVIFKDSISSNISDMKLVISNSKLKDTGVEIESDLRQEIDKTLQNCKLWF